MSHRATHELKADPNYFDAVWTGHKPFEVRWDDRGYQRGDDLVLREYDQTRPCECHPGVRHNSSCARYTGRTVQARVGWVLASTTPRGRQPGFSGRGYVVLALTNAHRSEVRDGQAYSAPVPPAAWADEPAPAPPKPGVTVVQSGWAPKPAPPSITVTGRTSAATEPTSP